MKTLRIPILLTLFLPTPLLAQEEEVEVPLVLYTNAEYPNGPRLGNSAGAAFLDYDHDGFIDVYINKSARLWHNDAGLSWTLANDLDVYLPPIGNRYGASCADYDNDGFPDIATEARETNSDDCFHLLRNLGGDGTFLDVAVDPTIVLEQPCDMNAETACWADVDEDGDLDLWATAYQVTDDLQPSGNRFFENLGPVGPGGAYQLALRTEEAGLGAPPNVSRPEGAQMLDYDRDGDVDAFAQNVIWQNRTVTSPSFVALRRSLTGITLANTLDEGALFADYDLDGDPDLFCLYSGFGNRLWENRGDGTFFFAAGVIDAFMEDASEGSSAEDWDLDGDLDYSGGPIMRRNMLMETGERFFKKATDAIREGDNDFGQPAWGDWDLDGDPDCLMANFNSEAHLYENTTYDRDTPLSRRMTVRIRPVRDAGGIPDGLETEFGATVELRVHGDTSGFVRRRFVASSHGYLQQGEYALTMALPPGPDPAAPARGVVFDLLVDFPSLESRGIQRVDHEINRCLGGIELGELSDRTITVFRSGRVILDGVDHPAPKTTRSRRLTTTTNGLALPDLGAPLPDPEPAPGASWFVGIELDTSGARGPLSVHELIVDGVLDDVAPDGRDFNVAVWNVNPGHARMVWSGAFEPNPRNRRSFLPVPVSLVPGQTYRVVARVSELRASPLTVPDVGDEVLVHGGLSFQDLQPRAGRGLKEASVDPASVYLAVRFRGNARPRLPFVPHR